MTKTIHTYWNSLPLPGTIAKFVQSWRDAMPDWEVWIWTDDDVLGGLLPLNEEEMDLYTNWKTYSPTSNEWQFKSNIARYAMLHYFGGLWLDADFEVLKDLTPLIEGADVAVARENPDFLNNGILWAATPNQPFFWNLRTDGPKRVRAYPQWRSNRQNGPHLITATAALFPYVRIIPTESVYPVTYKMADSFPYGTFDPKIEFPEAYAVHHWGNRARKEGRPFA